MKSLSHIKTCYAQEKHFRSWEHFCSVANDAMFIRAIDDVAALFAQAEIDNIAPFVKKIYVNATPSKRNKRGRRALSTRF